MALRPCAALALALAAAAPARGSPALAVAAAANLKPALEAFVAGFRARHPGVDVEIAYGASGTLVAQIRNGAPFDVFLSADAGYPRALAASGLAAGPAFTYAVGKLAVWLPRGSGVDLDRGGLAALLDPAVAHVAVANPAIAPYGAAAEAALRTAGILDALRSRLVVGQSVSQAAQLAFSGAAQAAFLPLSLALAPPLATSGRRWLVPPSSYPALEQDGVVLRRARDAALASAFAAELLGPGGREVLERSGYGLPAR